MPDERHMWEALALAAHGRGRTAPNPMVGAIVVSAGRIVGRGWHRRAGAPHAEVVALDEAGAAASGGALYVNLEPCCHHGRTPPCTEAVLASGVRMVIAAMQDPFPQVDGGGLQRLREAGLQVECGLLESEARELNRAYLKAVRSGLPWVTLKLATTLDGRIATRTGDSRWITGEESRAYVHRLRDWHDAVLIGRGTAAADDPLLTARIEGARDPLRVVVDARAELSPESRLACTANRTPTLLAVAEGVEAARLSGVGIEIEPVAAPNGRIDLGVLFRRLVGRGVHSVLCEGGARLAGSLLAAGLVDEVVWFIAPKLLGGDDGRAPLAGSGVERMADAVPLRQVRTERFGDDLAVFGYLTEP